MTYKNDHGKTWLLVFYHNSISGDWFTTEDEMRSINTPNRFSILGQIDNSYLIDGFFEFLLEYPLIGGSNQWLQKIHPLSTTGEADNVFYQCVRIDSGIFWGDGLKRSSNTADTFLDSSRDSFWYSVGAKRSFQVDGMFPGFYEGESYAPTSRCKL